MPFIFARHKVADYNKWKSAFDSDIVNRKTHGSQGAKVFCDSSDSNWVSVIMEFDTKENCNRFMDRLNSDEMKNLMRESGVVSGTESYAFTDPQITDA